MQLHHTRVLCKICGSDLVSGQWHTSCIKMAIEHRILILNLLHFSFLDNKTHRWAEFSVTRKPMLVETGSQWEHNISPRVSELCKYWCSILPSCQLNTHSSTCWERGVHLRTLLMVSLKLIGRLIPVILVPMASLFGSLGSPCGLGHDDLIIYIHNSVHEQLSVLLLIG